MSHKQNCTKILDSGKAFNMHCKEIIQFYAKQHSVTVRRPTNLILLKLNAALSHVLQPATVFVKISF